MFLREVDCDTTGRAQVLLWRLLTLTFLGDAARSVAAMAMVLMAGSLFHYVDANADPVGADPYDLIWNPGIAPPAPIPRWPTHGSSRVFFPPGPGGELCRLRVLRDDHRHHDRCVPSNASGGAHSNAVPCAPTLREAFLFPRLGYGDEYPTTDGGQLFALFYLPVITCQCTPHHGMTCDCV